MKSKLGEFITRLVKTIKKPEMRILPGQLAFFFVVSIVPLIALIGTILSGLNIDMNFINKFTEITVPKGAISVLEPIINGNSVSFNSFIFYTSAFILASNGTHSMIIASNLIYKIPNKDYLSRKIKSLIMTIVLVMLLLFVIIVPTFGDFIIKTIIRFINNNNMGNSISIIYGILKYPISLFFMYFCIKLLYVMAPDAKISSKYTSYGSVFTSILWIIASEIYSIYSTKFSNYNLFYGSMSDLLILLFWIYILAYIFVLGMALNAAYYKDKD